MRLVAEEAALIFEWLRAEVRFFNPSGLPLVDDGVDADHPKVAELPDLMFWSEGMIWSSPLRHGAMTGIMKSKIEWIPLSLGGVRLTQGKTLAVMQVPRGWPGLQQCEPAAHSGAVDAAADHPQSVFCSAGLG